MAVFDNLHDAGLVLASHLRRNLDPTLTDVLAGPPLENAAATTEALRISLMWVTPQPTHRNDPWEDDGGGQLSPPPVSLSAFYLVTAYGTDDAGQPIQAINRLGQAIQIFETASILDLPLPDDPTTPAVDPTPGTGRMSIAHVPTAADLMEKIYSPLQMRHRPWALFEVGPVQLRRLDQPRPTPDVVHPDGVRLVDVQPVAPPRILRVTPSRLRAGGRVRLDTVDAGGASALRIGGTGFDIVATPGAGLEIAPPDAFGRLFATYPGTDPTGAVDAVLRGAAASDPAPVTVEDSTSAGVDAPTAALTLGDDLTLTGGSLDTATTVYLWPDGGVMDPGQVVAVAPTTVAADSVAVAGADLTAAGVATLPYRVSVQLATGAFTPYVLLEVVS